MDELAKRVTEISGQNVYSCYQCGNCSAGCMFTDEMDMLPHQAIALVQNGDENVLERKHLMDMCVLLCLFREMPEGLRCGGNYGSSTRDQDSRERFHKIGSEKG